MKKRFIKSVIETAKTTEMEMPWSRGMRRRAFIEKRVMQASKERKTA